MTVEEMVQDSLSQKLALCSLGNQNSYDFHLAKEKKKKKSRLLEMKEAVKISQEIKESR